jgi:hypothetical protein
VDLNVLLGVVLATTPKAKSIQSSLTLFRTKRKNVIELEFNLLLENFAILWICYLIHIIQKYYLSFNLFSM